MITPAVVTKKYPPGVLHLCKDDIDESRAWLAIKEHFPTGACVLGSPLYAGSDIIV
jgi:hypothetical protein